MPDTDKNNDHANEDQTDDPTRIDKLEIEKKEPKHTPLEDKSEQTEKTETTKNPFQMMGFRQRRNMEYPARDDGKPIINPWDIDERGVLLEEKKKHRPLTLFEKWLLKKRETEGNEVKCPKCGEINYELPYILGEKCSSCGFRYEDDTGFHKRMKEQSKVLLRGISEITLDDSIENLRNILALPAVVLQNRKKTFNCSFRTSSYLYSLFLIIGLAFTGFYIIPEIEIHDNYKFMITMLNIGIIIGIIFSFISLIRTIAVTVIVIESDRVSFPGVMGVLQMKYEDILSISNYRYLNGRARLIEFFDSIFDNFYSDEIYTVKHRSEIAVDNSSSSREYTNYITISTARNSISFAFTGGDNSQFVQALASIIYLTKLKNKKCLISLSAYRAAEKGHEHYSSWRRRHQ